MPVTTGGIEMNRRARVSRLLVSLLLGALLLIPGIPTRADDWYGEKGAYYQLLDDSGWPMASLALTVYEGDEYISADNKHYRVKSVDTRGLTAQTEFLGVIDLTPYKATLESVPVSQGNDEPGVILMYCTHTDESYVPTDGSESKPEGGGILEVARALKGAIEEKGGKAVLDETNHTPHDAGAYERSRRTVAELMRQHGPVAAILDVHRDAVPAEQYSAEVDGQEVSKVRMVVGGRNQNSAANKEFAYKIKAAADEAYPDLVKDIFIGKGNYNQEISPHSLILECGTHETPREQVEAAMPMVAEAVCKAVYGGIPNEGKDNDQQEQQGGEGQQTASPRAESQGGAPQATGSPSVEQQSIRKDGGGTGRGLIWMLVIVAAAVAAYFLISMGGHERKEKMKGFFGREFGEFGRKKK
jgi:stage II sporulation protein P